MSATLVVPEPLLLVCWADITTSAEWTDDRDMDLATCLTAGWLIAEDEEKIVLANSAGIGEGFDQWRTRYAIPKSVVRWQRPLLCAPEFPA